MKSVSLKDALDRNTIAVDFEANGKEDVFEELVGKFFEEGYIDSTKKFLAAVREREHQGVTRIGDHVAIPHGRSDSVKKNGIAIAILHQEIEWESLDDTGAKVDVLFAVGADGEGSKQHLQLLALFARRLAKADVIQALLHAETVDEVIAALTQ